MSSVEDLKDFELREMLIAHGVDAPPVTQNTRRAMERKLLRVMNKEQASESPGHVADRFTDYFAESSMEKEDVDYSPPFVSEPSFEQKEESSVVEHSPPVVKLRSQTREALGDSEFSRPVNKKISHGLKVEADISGLFDRGDNLHAEGLIGPSYRRRPLHEESPEPAPRRPVARSANQEPEPQRSNLTRFLMIVLGLLIISFVVYMLLNSDPFDSNPVLTME